MISNDKIRSFKQNQNQFGCQICGRIAAQNHKYHLNVLERITRPNTQQK